MSSIFGVSRSGLEAAQVRLRVAAHNVANVATEGFRRQAVQTSSTQAGGVSVQV